MCFFTLLHFTGKEKDKKYTVIHISSADIKGWTKRFNDHYGKDNTAAVEMRPEYVKNILKQYGDDMLNNHDIYLIDSSTEPDREAHDRLANDPDLKDRITVINCDLGGRMYLAILADVYLGNPVGQLGLWIARMRLALGFGAKDTYVLTEKQGDKWASLLHDNNYLDLYDAKKLGTPWMG